MVGLTTHGRYAYSPIVSRPRYDWPEGQGLAVYLALNIEHFPFAEGMGIPLANAQPEPDVVNYSWRDYGNRVAVWRLLAEFDRLALPATVLANTAMYDHAPAVMDAFRVRGDEFVGHGITNAERQGTMSEAAERDLIARTTARLSEKEGKSPRGWMGPWVSQSRVTPDLLAEAGYSYMMEWAADDQPIWMTTRNGGRILSIPYPRPSNDIPELHGAGHTPRDYADILIDQFDEMRDQARAMPLVFNLSLHPFLVGWPYRLRHIRRVLEHIATFRNEIWLTHAGAITAHIETLPDGTVP
tara:strand:+ start:62152 stop:63045 length:894 start_codon:yes stop_codon:yes gene_type:complete